MQGGGAPGRVAGAAQHLAVHRDDATQLGAEGGGEALEPGAELHRIKPAEQAREGIVAGQAGGQIEEAAQVAFLGAGEQGHGKSHEGVG